MSSKLRRYMQTVCCHSKLTASVSLANHVPLVKRALEVFVYRLSKSLAVRQVYPKILASIQWLNNLVRAKAMLAANDCSDAFSLGTLVNRQVS